MKLTDGRHKRGPTQMKINGRGKAPKWLDLDDIEPMGGRLRDPAQSN